MEIKTQSDLYFEKKQNTKAPVGLYVENQLEKARIGREDQCLCISLGREDDSLAWAGRGRWKVREVDTFDNI